MCKQPADLIDVVRLFEKCVRVPLAAGLVDEVAAIDVDRTGENGARVIDRMNGVCAQTEHVADVEEATACLLQSLLAAAVDRVRLGAAVDADGRPHPVIVGEDAHLRRPDHVQHREGVRAEQCVKVGLHRLRPRQQHGECLL